MLLHLMLSFNLNRTGITSSCNFQIREVKNGYPSTNILPFSEVSINPQSVTTSTDASVATTFTFPSPVFIQENTEYAFVLLANSQEYNVYVSRVGQTI